MSPLPLQLPTDSCTTLDSQDLPSPPQYSCAQVGIQYLLFLGGNTEITFISIGKILEI